MSKNSILALLFPYMMINDLPFSQLFTPSLVIEQSKVLVDNADRKEYPINFSQYKVRYSSEFSFAGFQTDFIGYSIGSDSIISEVEGIVKAKLDVVVQAVTQSVGPPQSEAETTAETAHVSAHQSRAWTKDGYFLMLSSIRRHDTEYVKIWIKKIPK